MRLPKRTGAQRRSRTRVLAVAGAVLAIVTGYLVASAVTANAAPILLSQGQPATASSTQSGATPPNAAFDGNLNTRWSSGFSDPQWIGTDLGAPAVIR